MVKLWKTWKPNVSGMLLQCCKKKVNQAKFLIMLLNVIKGKSNMKQCCPAVFPQGLVSLQASSPILSKRSRETCFTRPNKRACSQAKDWYVGWPGVKCRGSRVYKSALDVKSFRVCLSLLGSSYWFFHFPHAHLLLMGLIGFWLFGLIIYVYCLFLWLVTTQQIFFRHFRCSWFSAQVTVLLLVLTKEKENYQKDDISFVQS